MPAQLTSAAAPVVLTASSPLGHIAVAVHEGELLGVAFGHRSAAAAKTSLRSRLSATAGSSSSAFGWHALRSAEGRGSAKESDSNPPDRDDVALAADVLDRLTRYADGEPVDFADVPVAVEHLTPFARRVVNACRVIRRGCTRSYGELAEAAGRPGAARAVGQVMATNRVPLVVPCHRVVGSGGRLGGFSAPDGLAMKRRLLDLES